MQKKQSINPFIDLEFIQELEVPKYPFRMPVTKSRNKRYFRLKYSKVKGEKIWKPRPLPKKYQQKLKAGIYSVNKGYLRDGNNNKVVANTRSHSTPKYEGYSGNDFSSGNYHPYRRNALVAYLKDFYRPFVRTLEKMHGDVPIRVVTIMKTTLDQNTQDASNYWFYYKYFEDCLFETNHPVTGKSIDPIIPDDSFEFVSQPGSGPLFVPVKKLTQRAFIFQFYKDLRHEYRTAIRS